MMEERFGNALMHCKFMLILVINEKKKYVEAATLSLIFHPPLTLSLFLRHTHTQTRGNSWKFSALCLLFTVELHVPT